MELNIEQARNGYILHWWEDQGEECVLENRLVCEDTEGAWGELEAAQKMLYAVLEYFGVYSSKHNRHNLVIKIEENENESGE